MYPVRNKSIIYKKDVYMSSFYFYSHVTLFFLCRIFVGNSESLPKPILDWPSMLDWSGLWNRMPTLFSSSREQEAAREKHNFLSTCSPSILLLLFLICFAIQRGLSVTIIIKLRRHTHCLWMGSEISQGITLNKCAG